MFFSPYLLDVLNAMRSRGCLLYTSIAKQIKRSIISLFLLSPLPDNEFKGSSPESKSVPYFIFDISCIRKVHQLFIVYKNYKSRRFYPNLSHIENLKPFPFIRRRLLHGNCLRENFIEHTCLHTERLILNHCVNGFEQLDVYKRQELHSPAVRSYQPSEYHGA